MKSFKKETIKIKNYNAHHSPNWQGDATLKINTFSTVMPFLAQSLVSCQLGDGGRYGVIGIMSFIKITLLAIISILIFSCSEKIEIYDQEWSYENQHCKVAFKIRNNEDYEKSIKVKLTAHKQRNLGKGGMVNDIIGEKTIIVDLRASEEQSFEETIKLLINKRPSMVTVNHF